MMLERLKPLRKAKGLTQVELARLLNLDKSSVAKYESRSANVTPSPEVLKKMAAILECSVDYLLGQNNATTQNNHVGIKIPVLGYVAAGIPIAAITDILDYEEIDEDLARRGEFFGLRIKGDSMTPLINNGDTVIVRVQPDVESGEIAVVCVNGDEATCKKFVKHKNSISLVSINSDMYDPIVFSVSEIEELPVVIIGKVVELRRTF